ncbi:hypothetical protein B0A48_07041 [Cryoendolithus antarcticus]|uniref:UBC core domain-containing protein n=1 Tax=Cryoendolithus antarcticus TaxID=1507870 RepID=A0A1V8T7T2_9PEZI|nr:hypothetical protein B0A48_07041 [Cryoendolithus antarcticus]
MWKLWRQEFETRGNVTYRDIQIWYDMKDSGDGLASGTYFNDSSTRFSTVLHTGSCTGHLEEESVFADPGRVRDPNQLLVLKVHVASTRQHDHSPRLIRLDVLKQMFEALINRMLGSRFKTHLGLITVSKRASMQTPLSYVIENFRRATTGMRADGDTALWDGMALARDQISDLDTTSHGVAYDCWNDGITVDTVSLGREENEGLRTLSYVLGGYTFKPSSLANALAMCEIKPVLSLTERPTPRPVMASGTDRGVHKAHFTVSKWRASYTTVSEDNFPERKPHPNVNDTFIPLSAASQLSVRSAAGIAGARSNLRTNRLMNEMRQLVAKRGPSTYDVYVSETDISFWKVVRSGPEETPYVNGNFLLYIHAEDRYPAFAPKVRFITRIKHVNVNPRGRICHPILDRDWTGDTSMSRLLDTIYGLLYQAEMSDPVNTTSTLGYHHDQVEYADEVRDFVLLYADKSRKEWRQEILGGDDWDSEDEGSGSEEEDRTGPGYSENDEVDEEDDDEDGMED